MCRQGVSSRHVLRPPIAPGSPGVLPFGRERRSLTPLSGQTGELLDGSRGLSVHWEAPGESSAHLSGPVRGTGVEDDEVGDGICVASLVSLGPSLLLLHSGRHRLGRQFGHQPLSLMVERLAGPSSVW